MQIIYSSELEAISGKSVGVTRSVVGQSGTKITLNLPVSYLYPCVVIVVLIAPLDHYMLYPMQIFSS